MKIHAGIIGTGFGAQVHAPILHKHPDYELTAISSAAYGKAGQRRLLRSWEFQQLATTGKE